MFHRIDRTSFFLVFLRNGRVPFNVKMVSMVWLFGRASSAYIW